MARLSILLLLLPLLACPGTVPHRGDGPTPADSGPPLLDLRPVLDQPTSTEADALQPDQAPVPDGPSSCSPEDATTTCDPVTPSGCAAGAGCYLVKGAYVDCVCPAGTVAPGGPCNTSTECTSGHGCVGNTAPGVCRRVCLPTAPSCGAAETCKAVGTLPQYGMCVP